MIHVFVGCDSRQPLAYNVLQHSIQRHTSRRVIIEPLVLDRLPIKRRGLTEFTYSRYLVPWLCDYQGTAIFMDADIAVVGDIGELNDQADGISAVQVNTLQPKFEWPSVMLFNCAKCTVLTPEYIDLASNKLSSLEWGDIGMFTKEWNHCVNKMPPEAAKLYHYTEGLPCWDEVRGSPLDKYWLSEYADMNRTATWQEMMGQSVHATPVIKRFINRKFGLTMAPATA